MHPSRHLSLEIGPLLTALLFCLMLPARLVTGLDGLAHLAERLGLSTRAQHLATLAGNALTLALVFGLAWAATVALWKGLRRTTPQPPTAPHGNPLKRILGYALPCLLVWAVYVYAYWPGIMTSDSFDQWDQAHNLALLNDWHPVAHTLLIFLLTRVWDSPAGVMLVQTLGMGLAWGGAMAACEAHGAPRRLLLPLTLVFALLPFNGILLVSLWKDIPYTIATLGLVLLLGQVVLSQGAWLETHWRALLLGLTLAGVGLLRHNGLAVLGLTLALLILFYARRRWRGVVLTGVTALATLLVVQNGLAFGLLKAAPNDPAVSYVVPIQHISAVIHAGGQVTPQEQAILERIAPLDVWGKAYLRYNADSLSKPWGYQKDPQVLEKIGQNRDGLLRVFLAQAMRHPRTVLTSELDLTTIVWRITPPNSAEYRDYRFLFNLSSFERAGKSVAPQFVQVNQNTWVKALLDSLLTASTQAPVADTFLWEGGLALFLSLAFGLYGLSHHGRRFLLVLAPTLANAASLALAMPGDNFRFVYPIVAPAALIALLAWMKAAEPGSTTTPSST